MVTTVLRITALRAANQRTNQSEHSMCSEGSTATGDG